MEAEGIKDKIRILIVDDVAETVDTLRKVLHFEPDMEVVGSASDAHEGVELAQQLRPDVVLMDITFPSGPDGIPAAEAITQIIPLVQVIMMSVRNDYVSIHRSLLAGAREYLVKPFSVDELVTAIRRVYSLKPRSPRSRPAGRA